jgi:hypothetical protein
MVCWLVVPRHKVALRHNTMCWSDRLVAFGETHLQATNDYIVCVTYQGKPTHHLVSKNRAFLMTVAPPLPGQPFLTHSPSPAHKQRWR